MPPVGKFKSFTSKRTKAQGPFPPNDHLGRYSLKKLKRDFQIHPQYMQEYYDFLYQHNKKYGLHTKMTYTIRELIEEVTLNSSKYKTAINDPDRLFDIAEVDFPNGIFVNVHFDGPDVVNIVIREDDWDNPSKLLDKPLKYYGKDAYKKKTKEEIEKEKIQIEEVKENTSKKPADVKTVTAAKKKPGRKPAIKKPNDITSAKMK